MNVRMHRNGVEDEISLLRQAVLDMSSRVGSPEGVGRRSVVNLSWLDVRESIYSFIYPYRHFGMVLVALLMLHRVPSEYASSDAHGRLPVVIFGCLYVFGFIGIGILCLYRQLRVKQDMVELHFNTHALVSYLSASISNTVKGTGKVALEREAGTLISKLNRQLVLAESLVFTSYLCSPSTADCAAGANEGLSNAMTEHLLDTDEAEFFSQNDVSLVPMPGIVYAWIHSLLMHISSSGLLGSSTQQRTSITHAVSLLTSIEKATNSLKMHASMHTPAAIRFPFMLLGAIVLWGVIEAAITTLVSHSAINMTDSIIVYLAVAALAYCVSIGIEFGGTCSLPASTILARLTVAPSPPMSTFLVPIHFL